MNPRGGYNATNLEFNFTASVRAKSNVVNPMEEDGSKVALMFILGAMAFVGFLVNVLTICVFSKGKSSSWKEVRHLVISLAVSDLCFCVVSPIPTGMRLAHLSLPASPVFCGVWYFLHQSFFLSSMLNTLAIAAERFAVIFFPTRTLGLGRGVRFSVIGLIWVLAFASNIEYIYHTLPKTHPVFGNTDCVPRMTLFEKYYYRFFYVLNLGYFIPVIIIIILYILIGVRMACRVNVGTNIDSAIRRNSRKMIQMLKTLIVDGVVTIATFSLYKLYYVLSMVVPSFANYIHFSDAQPYIDLILVCITCTNCLSTPIIYFCLNKDFKRDCYNLLPRRFTPDNLNLRRQSTTSTTRAVI